jgi:SAM-dependent methyltransferase
LSESYQKAWLAELRRVLKPGGLLLLSFYSRHVWQPLEDGGSVAGGGFVFRASAKWKGILPDWYQTALQSEARIVRAMEEAGFVDVVYLERRLGDQDLVGARKPAG